MTARRRRGRSSWAPTGAALLAALLGRRLTATSRCPRASAGPRDSMKRMLNERFRF